MYYILFKSYPKKCAFQNFKICRKKVSLVLIHDLDIAGNSYFWYFNCWNTNRGLPETGLTVTVLSATWVIISVGVTFNYNLIGLRSIGQKNRVLGYNFLLVISF